MRRLRPPHCSSFCPPPARSSGDQGAKPKQVPEISSICMHAHMHMVLAGVTTLLPLFVLILAPPPKVKFSSSFLFNFRVLDS